MLQRMKEALEIAEQGRKLVSTYAKTQVRTARTFEVNPAPVSHEGTHASLAA
jgi:hypothetical protein